MEYQGWDEILMITLKSSKKLGGYKIMSHTISSKLLSCKSKFLGKFVNNFTIDNFHTQTSLILKYFLWSIKEEVEKTV